MSSGDSDVWFTTSPPLTDGSERAPRENGSVIRCEPRDSYASEIIELTFASATLSIHVFVIIAMLAYRNVVKRNVVNIYAGNVVFASIVTNAWRIYVSGHVIAMRNAEIDYQEELREDKWESFKQGFYIVVTLIMSGSIGLVINAMRSIQFRVHKTVGGVASRATDGACEAKKKCSRRERLNASYKNHPKTWAAFYIGLIWLIPLLVTAFSTGFNSCRFGCHCDGGLMLRGKNASTNCKELVNNSNACSEFMPPVSRVTLQVAFLLWLVYLLVLTFSLFKTFKDLGRLRRQRCESSMRAHDEENKMAAVENGEDTNSESKTPEKDLEMEQLTPENTHDAASRKLSNGRRSVAIKLGRADKPCARISGSIFIQNLRKNFKLLVAMYAAYVIGAAPLAVLTIADGISGVTLSEFGVENRNNVPIEFVIFGLLPIAAEVVCTVLLCTHLSGVKLSVRSLLVKLTRC